MDEHVPVLLTSVLNALEPENNKVYFDGTFGGGGYTSAILKSANCNVIATDRDSYVQRFADETQKEYGDRFHFYHAKFSQIKSVLSMANMQSVDAVILDLGMSNFQLENADRGFSFKREGDLDMRMGLSDVTALDIIKKYSEKDLANIIYEFGEEPFSRRIAKNIKQHIKDIHTTVDLAKIVHKSVGYHGKTDTATKTFQALRICVNNELEELQIALNDAVDVLNPGGKIIVVTFHSLEDRIVKNFFKELHMQNNGSKFKLYSKKPIVPTVEEIKLNPKSRSAKMRCLVKL